MRVITLNDKEFQDDCQRLGRQILASGYSPELVIGIRTGGEYVANEMKYLIPDAEFKYVELQRPTTSHKNSVKNILTSLPTPLLNLLRIIESYLLSLKRPSEKDLPSFSLPEDIREQLPRRILIVDDAVDSGKTLLSIITALKELNNKHDIRSAVITVTTDAPIVEPDYSLYHDKTLIRFPWSLDNKK